MAPEKDLHQMTPEELGLLFPVSIAAYDQQWEKSFQAEKKRIAAALGSNIALRIEHFGSTAVPGLASKPVIDILLEIPESEQVKEHLITLMSRLGYDYILRSDGLPPYLMFVRGYTSDGYKGQIYHVHAAPHTHRDLWDRVYFRNYLISNPDVAKEYEKLKRKLASRFQHHREKYTDGKSEFVKRITRLAKDQKEAML